MIIDDFTIIGAFIALAVVFVLFYLIKCEHSSSGKD